MQGLRKQEGQKFENFFKLVQLEAKKQDCVFFLDNVDAKLIETGDFECSDMHGWLIHEAHADLFEPEFLNNTDKQFDFDDFYTYVDFKIVDGAVRIIMEEYPRRLNILEEMKKN